MPTIKDLKFKKAETGGSIPVVTCNCCGKKAKISNGHYLADFPIDESNHVTFFCCSAECVYHLHSSDIADVVQRLINDTLERAAWIHLGHDSEEYKDFLIKNNIKK